MDLASTSSWRASIQARLVGLPRQPPGGDAGLVRRNAALPTGEIGGQGVGGQIRGAGQPRHLGLPANRRPLRRSGPRVSVRGV